MSKYTTNMSILGASFMPHPPIVLPDIGRGEEEKVEKTYTAMSKVGEEINNLAPQTVILFSPHGSLQRDSVGWAANETLVGDLGNFGASNLNFEFQNDTEIVNLLCSELENTVGYLHPGDSTVLDHGALVPLSFIDKDNKYKLVYGGYCYRDAAFHFVYGKLMGELLKGMEKNIYIIASGDLSHRLIPGAPAGYNPEGKTFDELIVKIAHDNDWEAVKTIPEDLIEKAGECGLRSFAMYAGLIRSLEFTTEVLSYEGPFGVGYLVAKA